MLGWVTLGPGVKPAELGSDEQFAWVALESAIKLAVFDWLPLVPWLKPTELWSDGQSKLVTLELEVKPLVFAWVTLESPIKPPELDWTTSVPGVNPAALTPMPVVLKFIFADRLDWSGGIFISSPVWSGRLAFIIGMREEVDRFSKICSADISPGIMSGNKKN